MSTLRNTFLVTSSWLMLAGVSSAADLVAKAPPPPAPLPASWAGFYLGVHGGYGWKDNSFAEVISLNPFLTLGGINSKGAVYGGQAGYNWQYGRLVAGVELDFSATDIRGNSNPVVRNFAGGVTITDQLSDNVSYLGTARGRLGWAPTDTFLLYGTAGLAWERFKRIDTETVVTPAVVQNVVSTSPFDRFGWVAGAGVEAKLSGSNWVGRVEYLHYGFGGVESGTSVTTTTPGSSFADQRGEQNIDIVRAAVSYKFGEIAPYAAPVYAKAPVVAAPTTWAGFYLGVHGGYGWKRNSFAEVIALNPLVTIGGIDSKGGVFGGQVGYNWQYGRAVAGLELDFSASDIKGSATPVTRNLGGGVTITDSRSDNVKYLGTARGRLGWTPADNVLLYGTAGLAWERFNREDGSVVTVPGVSQVVNTVSPFDRFGWVAGAGVESLMFGTNWVGRLEYLHYGFGGVESGTSVTTTTPGSSFADQRGEQNIDIVRAAVSYKFGEPAVAPVRPMYTKGPAIPSPVTRWAGFYLGAHGGYGWERNNFAEVISTTPLVTIGNIKSQGGVYGGQVGYNWQYARAVAGLELDFSATSISGDSNTVIRDFPGGLTITDLQSDKISYLGTARGRLGWTATDTVLLYGTAGLAWERLKRIDTETVVTPAVVQNAATTSPRDHFGWVAGVGAETLLFGTNW
ncbi:MAG: hypothetical protein WAV72_00065, partial [Bradyrhizobium sp.]